jgi:hypothetical protein
MASLLEQCSSSIGLLLQQHHAAWSTAVARCGVKDGCDCMYHEEAREATAKLNQATGWRARLRQGSEPTS